MKPRQGPFFEGRNPGARRRNIGADARRPVGGGLVAFARRWWRRVILLRGRGGASGSDGWLLLERARAAAASRLSLSSPPSPALLPREISSSQILAGARAKQTERLVPITFCEVPL